MVMDGRGLPARFHDQSIKLIQTDPAAFIQLAKAANPSVQKTL